MFGQNKVPGYLIDEITCRFQVSALSPTPKQGDLITRSGVVYEVTKVEKLVRDTQWKLTGNRAFLSADYSTTCTVQRGTLSQNASGMDVQTWGTFASNVACYLFVQGQPQEMGDVFDVAGVTDISILFLGSGGSGVRASDRIVLGGVTYEILNVMNDSRIAMLPEIKLRRLQ